MIWLTLRMLKSFQFNSTDVMVWVFLVLCVISLYTIKITKRSHNLRQFLKILVLNFFKILVPNFAEIFKGGRRGGSISEFPSFFLQFPFFRQFFALFPSFRNQYKKITIFYKHLSVRYHTQSIHTNSPRSISFSAYFDRSK